MPENNALSLRTNIEKNRVYFGGLDLEYRTPEIVFPKCEIEKDNFKHSQGKETGTENKESFDSKVLKQKQHCVAVAVTIDL